MNTANKTSGQLAVPGVKQLLAYGTLAFPLAAAFVTLQVFVPTYYAQISGMSLSLVGLLLLIARLWDTFTDPIVGYLSDRTPARLGKRKIWVVLSAPLVCVSVWMLFVPPDGAGKYYLLAWTLAIYIAGTMAIVPMNAWGAELSPIYEQRNRVVGYRVAFGLAGTLGALVVAAIVGSGEGVGSAVSSGAADNSEASALASVLVAVAWMISVTLTAAAALVIFLVPDKSETSLPDGTFVASLALLTEPSPFRQLLCAFFLNGIGNAIPATLFVLFVTKALQIPDHVGPMLFVYFSCAAISVPVWVKLADKIGKHKAWISGIVCACFFFAATPFIDAQNAFLFYVVIVATGLAAGADLAIPSSLNGDLIEWDAVKTGLRRPGLFFALWGTVTKLSFALAIGIAFPLLDVFGFSATGSNTDSALAALAFVYCVPCIAFKLAAIFVMRNYPLTREVHDQLRQQLAAADV